jgi:hypothetical protein
MLRVYQWLEKSKSAFSSGLTKREMRSGSCTGDLAGCELAAVFIGKITMHPVHGADPRLPSNFPKSPGDGPFFGEGHFAEPLDLDGVERFEGHGASAGAARQR